MNVYTFEKKIELEKVLTNFKYEIGCDEAGRGCLSGPVVAAAVILGENFENDIINDSKQLSEKKRNSLRSFIEKHAKFWAIGIVWPSEIDKINILNASFLAMHRAIDQLDCPKEMIIVDGNRFNPYHDIPHQCIVKGDSKYMNIAAASILAKTYRDEYMEKIHGEFPMYDWKQNKGYPTKSHRFAIEEYGATPYHRMSFRLLPEQLNLDL